MDHIPHNSESVISVTIEGLECSTTPSVSDTPKTFFKALSFADDPFDDDAMLPFESFFDSAETTDVPSEFMQPFFGSDLNCESVCIELGDSSETRLIINDILDSVLEAVVGRAVPPRKIATVYPFSLNNLLSLESGEVATEGDPPQTSGLRLAGFAVDPASGSDTEHGLSRPTLKLANFAVDPSSSSQPAAKGVKLPNFAVDPANSSQGADQTTPSAVWHTRDDPPPLTQRLDQQ